MPYVIDDNMPEYPTRLYRIQSFERMTKKAWRADDKPHWWVRIGFGNVFKFLTIPKIPGYQKIDIHIDLDKNYIPPGEVIYFGVGYSEDCIRDEYHLKLEPEQLQWYLKPRTEQSIFNHWLVWWTRDYRYRIIRCLPGSSKEYYPEDRCFAASFGRNFVLCRCQTLEECLNYVEKDCRKRYTLADLYSNADTLLIVASKSGMDYLPDIEESNENKERNSPKEAKKGKKKKVSVTKMLIVLLERHSRADPISSKDLLCELMDIFPDKSPSSLWNTIRARLSDLESRHGKHLQSNKKGYLWIKT